MVREYRAQVTRRTPAIVETMPVLARPLVRGTLSKPRGAARLRHKLFRQIYRVAHHTLRMEAPGVIALSSAGEKRSFEADFTNSAYVDYANRIAAGGYEPEVTGFLDTVAAGAATVYDIGANWGYFGAALVTNPTFEGHVHAFEIAPRTFRDLTKLVTQCRLTERITCHRFGLSERRGTVRILEGRHSALTQVSDDATSGIEARVEALDTLDLPAPDIIKLDVEGHEASVLKGGSALLARARPLIVFESWYSAHQPESMLVPISFLETLGYDFYRLAWGTTLGGRPAYVIDCPAGEGATATLMMRKLSPAERPLIPVALNIVAVPVDRPERLGPSWTAS